MPLLSVKLLPIIPVKYLFTNTKLLSKKIYIFESLLGIMPGKSTLMRLAENERSEVRSASRIILLVKLSRVNI
jgi:hypothetical protein